MKRPRDVSESRKPLLYQHQIYASTTDMLLFGRNKSKVFIPQMLRAINIGISLCSVAMLIYSAVGSYFLHLH
jgi:hypothetical protein